jgi:hypothetical protein
LNRRDAARAEIPEMKKRKTIFVSDAFAFGQLLALAAYVKLALFWGHK